MILVVSLFHDVICSQPEDYYRVIPLFHEYDENVDGFTVIEKRDISPKYSVMIARAKGINVRKLYGIFIVNNQGFEKPIALDLIDGRKYSFWELKIRDIGEDYVIVDGAGLKHLKWNVKYFFDIDKRLILKKINFNGISIKSMIRFADSLFFLGHGDKHTILINLHKTDKYYNPSFYTITQEIDGKSLPKLEKVAIIDGELFGGTADKMELVYTHEGWKLLKSLDRQSPSLNQNYETLQWGFLITEDNGDTISYQLPIQNVELMNKYRPELEFDSHYDIGFNMKLIPGNKVRNKIWFGNHFYAGEGSMGIGWIGYFDLEDRSYQIYYLEKVIPWSVRSIFADTKNVLAGLVCYSEYLYTGQGVIKFNVESQQVTIYPIVEPISHICGCSGV